jgi:hypothetical protein
MSHRQTGADGAPPNGSTGPRSATGKARSSMNALKTGIYSNSLIIPGEDPAHLTTLLDEYFERYRPAVPEQRDLVDILVRSTWTLRRLGAAEAQVLVHQMKRAYNLNADAPLGHAFVECDRALARLQRIVNSTQRNYRDALRELEHLQNLDPAIQPASAPQPAEAEPVSPSPQFVPSSSTPPPPTAPRPAPRVPRKPLPYHRPGATCYFDPIDPTPYERCPLCFPPNGSPETAS